MAREKTTWKWNEYNQWKEQQNKTDEPEQEKTVRPGQCPDCGHGSFQLRVKAGKMDRICKGCGIIVENV